MSDELENKVSTDQPMREAEQSLVAKVNALIDAYWSHNYLINQMSAKIEALQSDMQAVKNKIGL